jgi:hypothetical protein
MEKRSTINKIQIHKIKALNIADNKFSLEHSPNEYESTKGKDELNQVRKFSKGNISFRN